MTKIVRKTRRKKDETITHYQLSSHPPEVILIVFHVQNLRQTASQKKGGTLEKGDTKNNLDGTGDAPEKAIKNLPLTPASNFGAPLHAHTGALQHQQKESRH